MAGHDHVHGPECDHGHDPFAHPHHHHRDEGEDREPLDPASQSLSDALRVSFRILKLLMVLLVLAFLFGRWVEVKEGEVAVRLRFGAVQGEAGGEVLEPGWHFALPQGIDEIVKVPTTVQSLSLHREFWFEVPEGSETKGLDELEAPEGGLVPGRDGALLTADRNIVHGRWSVSYAVGRAGAVRFLRHVGSLEASREIVRDAARRAIVHVAARTEAAAFLGAKLSPQAILGLVQAELDAVRSGITVTAVSQDAQTPPLAARKAFAEVTQAVSERAQKIAEAQRERSRLLNPLAGKEHGTLLQAIDDYGMARRGSDEAAAGEAEKRIDDLLATVSEGQVHDLLRQAEDERVRIVETVKAETETFERLLPRYQSNKRLFREKHLQGALEEIFASPDVETFYLPPGQKEIWLEINRDPAVKKAREEERLLRLRGGSHEHGK